MENGISEKGLSVNRKVKIVNFPGTSENILKKLDEIIKEKPDNLIVHVGTNDIANNATLLTIIKKIFNKFLKNHYQHLSHFDPSLSTKTRKP